MSATALDSKLWNLSSWYPSLISAATAKDSRHKQDDDNDSDDDGDTESTRLLHDARRGWDGRAAVGDGDDEEALLHRKPPENSRWRRGKPEAAELGALPAQPSLPPHLAWVRKPPPRGSKIAALDLFRFRGCGDTALMLVATVLAALNGVMMPISSVLFGQLVQQLNRPAAAALAAAPAVPHHAALATAATWAEAAKRTLDITDPHLYARWSAEALSFVGFYGAVGLAALLTGYGEVGLWMIVSERQVHRVRVAYLHAVLRQEVAWFDANKPAELAAQMAADTAMMQQGMGEKVGYLVHFACTFLTGLAIGIAKAPQLTLAMLCLTPALAFSGGYLTKFMGELGLRAQAAYAAAGAVVEQATRGVRTVCSLGSEALEASRYSEQLRQVERIGARQGLYFGLGLGLTMMSTFIAYAMAFYFGARLLAADRHDAAARFGAAGCSHASARCLGGGDVVTVFFVMLMGSFALGQAVPNRQAISYARGFARKMFATIERRSAIDPASEAGERPGRCTGELELRDVHFSYPSRPSVEVLRGLSLTVGAGQTVGLVGASGSGKSTVVALLERFYDPSAGRVLLDGRDVRELNVRWLREQIGLVLQEPVLFDTSVAQNIAYGRAGATQYEVERAGRLANAHDFIMELPEKYATRAGQGGAELSGGQKQRIAIARALVREPKLLVFDEATSALDPESEGVVQEAVDQLLSTRRCTMVVIAHRLSTVRRATKIAVVDGGRLVEEGTHDELLARPDSRYANMCRLQGVAVPAANGHGDGAAEPSALISL